MGQKYKNCYFRIKNVIFASARKLNLDTFMFDLNTYANV